MICQWIVCMSVVQLPLTMNVNQHITSETEGKCLQNCGRTSYVVWCGDLGNNGWTIIWGSWDGCAERQGWIISEMNTLEGQQEWCNRPRKLQENDWSGRVVWGEGKRSTVWEECLMWTYQGKKKRAATLNNGKMRVREIWQRWVWNRTTQQTGQNGGLR